MVKSVSTVPEEILDEQRAFMKRVYDINMTACQQSGSSPYAFVHSYGCQQNVADAEHIKGMLAEMGYRMTDEIGQADVVIYNTCAVRENAEDRVFGNVGALKNQKRRNPSMIIGLCGCMMQQEHIAQRIKKSFPFVDLVFGTHALHAFPELLYEALTSGHRVFETTGSDGVIAEGLPTKRDGHIKAWVPIMYGCDNFCTYCIVPYVRGRERSRSSEAILKEVKELINEGFKEITLLGQNVNSYGSKEDEISFAELLRRIAAIDGDFRVRFMTSHPKDATKELIDTIAACDKICSHIHLPVQSGSNRILKQMNRRYTAEDYLDIIRYAKEKIPGVTFTSDIMVGFPSETYEDFKQTLALVKQVEYDALFTFLYSKRVGTKAAAMEDLTTDAEKSRWFRELLEVQGEIGRKRNASYVGQTLRVLADGKGRSGEGFLTGRSESNTIVDFEADDSLIGQFVHVKITEARNAALSGVLV
ncbi:tRNA (N6-isopentenyl adenosine(37)-C2)-methylthiotransferase MiaB [Candidatus Soleaferrea massiliensis]|uniref:tRNA (N6-isopentenyl adenosine(37)-C2)-methylthiotransferase MiaB n=1 Tax=Candidatus Soleaferrea massiliensis TaxID=1470354 RepID=UPI0009E5732A|nr:tRNA (N6-isopentenyl adenosine(37)-C2)-methylthiotransferase MiaB [Candidatus Soleaferrea massiliensis]